MDSESPKKFKQTLKKTSKTVVKYGKAKAKAMGSTPGKAAPSLRSGTSGTGAKVMLGGGRHPYAIGSELGSKQGPRKKQFEQYRGQPPASPFEGSSGYWLFPSIRENEVPIETGWAKDLDDWVAETFPHII